MQSGQNMEKYQLQTIADQTNIVQIYCNYTVIITHIEVTYPLDKNVTVLGIKLGPIRLQCKLTSGSNVPQS